MDSCSLGVRRRTPLLQAAEGLRSQRQRIGEEFDRLVVSQHRGVDRNKLYTCACAHARARLGSQHCACVPADDAPDQAPRHLFLVPSQHPARGAARLARGLLPGQIPAAGRLQGPSAVPRREAAPPPRFRATRRLPPSPPPPLPPACLSRPPPWPAVKLVFVVNGPSKA
jgi:hypothetical protein